MHVKHIYPYLIRNMVACCSLFHMCRVSKVRLYVAIWTMCRVSKVRLYIRLYVASLGMYRVSKVRLYVAKLDYVSCF